MAHHTHDDILRKASGNGHVSSLQLHFPVYRHDAHRPAGSAGYHGRAQAAGNETLLRNIPARPANHNQVFRYAIITGRARHNIAADLRGALRPRRVTHRAAVLTPEKVGQLLRDIDAYDGYFPLVCALKLAPLVFTRPTELRAAQWGEFDLEAAEWRIPTERMKMRRPHIVPLSAQSVAILRELQPWTGTGKYLFPSVRTEARPLSDVTMLNALRCMALSKRRNECPRLSLHCIDAAQRTGLQSGLD